MEPELLDIIVDPQDHQPLLYFADVDGQSWFYNERLKVRYPVTQQIAVLLAGEAQAVSDDEHDHFLAMQSVETGPKA